MPPDIYSYILAEEKNFEADEIRVADNWSWNFRNHVQLIFHLKNGVFYTGANDWLRAFKNIMQPILDLSYWSEQIEVKDVVFYIEEETGRVLSFLVKKYYEEVYVKKYNLDKLFDEITQSDLDYGGVLVQKTNEPKPEVLSLMKVAFCDQTDMLGGPLALKHHFSPSKLRKMKAYGWGDEKNGATISIEDLIVLAQNSQTPAGLRGNKNQTTGKTIEVYIVRGDLPDAYLQDNDDMEYYCAQLQIVAFYTDKNKKKTGVTLYRKEDSGDNLMFFTSQEVDNRGLGRGVGEGLLHPQIWSNFLEIHKMNMLEAGSKVPLYTDDPNYKNKNQIQDMETLEITTIEEGKVIRQVPTIAVANVQLFDKAIDEWYQQGQLSGSAFDPLLGKEAASGTTFRGQQATIAHGRGTHDKRRGMRAKFIEEIYRAYIIPELKKELLQGHDFLATLSLEEMQWVGEQLAENVAAKHQIEQILNGEIPTPKDQLKQQVVGQLQQRGNQHLLSILEGELEGIEIRMGINVANKQKDLASMVDKLTSVFQTIMANPYILKSPPIAKLFNKIIEASGLEPIDLSTLDIPAIPARRMTETINYADLATPPNETQKQMLTLAGIDQPQPVAPPVQQ